MPKIKDINGLRFGRICVIKHIGINKNRSIWLCKCDCGSFIEIIGKNLLSGNTKSCGCLKSEITIKRNTKHSLYGTVEHRAWNHMKNRCYNINNKKYPYYGGSGITVCKEWRESFLSFFNDMGLRPFGMTLDRINPYGNYEPNNCRWADHKTQANNKINQGNRYTGIRYLKEKT